MRYGEIYEAAKCFEQTKSLKHLGDEQIHTLLYFAVNYLEYGVINDDYLLIYRLSESLHHYCEKAGLSLPQTDLSLNSGTAKKLNMAYRFCQQANNHHLSELDRQLFMSGIISFNRVKHTASQFGLDDLKTFNSEDYNHFLKRFSAHFPDCISTKKLLSSIAKMNRFDVIHDYMVEKFKLKYSARIPRLDDYCKLLESMKKQSTQEALHAYFDRFDTAKFNHVSIYSPWNVCYYHGLRNALLSLSDKQLSSQFKAYTDRIKKLKDKAKAKDKQLGEADLEVLNDVKKSLKIR